MRTHKAPRTWPVWIGVARDDASELVLTELRRGLALVDATFNNSESRRRACLEASRIRDAVAELLLSPAIDEVMQLRMQRGLSELASKLELMQRSLDA